MKILLTLFVLLFSSSVVAEKLFCNVKAHGFDTQKWRDYDDNVYIIEYDNQNLFRLDTMTNIDKKLRVIKNNNNTISAILIQDYTNSFSPNIATITIYKEKLFIVSMWANDTGVTINRGPCYIM